MGWVTSRSGWLLELLTELIIPPSSLVNSLAFVSKPLIHLFPRMVGTLVTLVDSPMPKLGAGGVGFLRSGDMGDTQPLPSPQKRPFLRPISTSGSGTRHQPSLVYHSIRTSVTQPINKRVCVQPTVTSRVQQLQTLCWNHCGKIWR